MAMELTFSKIWKHVTQSHIVCSNDYDKSLEYHRHSIRVSHPIVSLELTYKELFSGHYVALLGKMEVTVRYYSKIELCPRKCWRLLSRKRRWEKIVLSFKSFYVKMIVKFLQKFWAFTVLGNSKTQNSKVSCLLIILIIYTDRKCYTC